MSRGRVLIVDDEKPLCGILKDTLEMELYEVEISHDLASAREKLENSRFDAALVDVFLSEEPAGLALGRHILSNYPQTSLVFMTGYAEEADVQAGYTAGAYACISKPFILEDVVRVLDMALDNRQNPAAAEPAS